MQTAGTKIIINKLVEPVTTHAAVRLNWAPGSEPSKEIEKWPV